MSKLPERMRRTGPTQLWAVGEGGNVKWASHKEGAPVLAGRRERVKRELSEGNRCRFGRANRMAILRLSATFRMHGTGSWLHEYE